jgi:exonuclease SbcC
VCNQLLKECFNGRFTVRLDTQSEQKNGNMKETFEVYVFDTLRPEKGKPLGMMSGGEEVLVNEYLTRSIALYAAQSSDAGYQTLFTDETDGPFDPQVKRTFMEMKRAVLKKGGYQREYFITHTPELWALADYTIDVTKL